MTGWRFGDRGWFVNDGQNLRSDAARALVSAELDGQNVLFGVHRWFAGGSSPDTIAIGSVATWDAELDRGRPGDNLLLVSLRDVADGALVHVGALEGDDRPELDRADVSQLDSFLAVKSAECAALRRQAHDGGSVRCSYRPFDADWLPFDLDQVFDGWPVAGGDLWLFDNELVWRDHHHRNRAPEPPETWSLRNGLLAIDGYLPDARGRVVCGGPY